MTRCHSDVLEGRIMPKQTFFNLPIKKQENLIHSAKKEFSRVPLNKASISNIVKNAGIARGSFYQYFDDKEDAFYFLLEQQTKKNNEEFTSMLKEKGGDLFDAFIEIFQKMLTEFQDQENRSFFQNVFLNMDYKMENKLTRNFNEADPNNQFSQFIAFIDIDKLNISSKEKVIHVMQIVTAVTFQNLMQNFAIKSTYEETINNYKFEMDLLKKGLYKGE